MQVLSLVGNATNELAGLLYNTGKVDEATTLRNKLKEKKWGLLTTSKYLATRNATIIFTPLPEDDFSGMFKFSVGLRRQVEEGMVVEVAFELTDGTLEKKRFTVDKELLATGLNLTSEPHKDFEKRAYDVIVSVFENEEAELPIHVHFQVIPSSLNTMNVQSWSELEKLYHAKNEK